ncbi:NUMOD4 motif protein [Bacteroides salyersiae]|uniref:NUMOD4 motif-containing HNH endonuclease n=1 Tax=Bacteroides salyersiae TaxID=291644 RepID=UPI001B8D42E6|nr:NUMOD4 motif-containing HNH endonuclease [Bacteroides salyersiae]MCS2403788.1 NUMOD4 motif-containing HNH endonuclease [Bacteroides salyersiae]QUT76903.1 NUMOD4 motif protein [Bacteroides salyersiae]
MIEIWKDIPQFEGLYQVSNIGNIRSVERIVPFGSQYRTIKSSNLRFFKKSNGYLSVKIYKDNRQYTMYVHRLVAMAFCDGYFDKADVNHKDGNKSNNVSSNLEWCTRSENQIHSVKVLHNKLGNREICKKWNSKPIVQLSIGGEKIRDWSSSFEVQRVLGFKESGIRKCLYGDKQKGRRSYQSHGYKWVYAKDYYQ